MDTELIIVIAGAAVIAVIAAWALAGRARRRRHAQQLERQRALRRIQGHEQEAELRASASQEAMNEARQLRTEAKELLDRAEEREASAERAARSAGLHQERAEKAREEIPH